MYLNKIQLALNSLTYFNKLDLLAQGSLAQFVAKLNGVDQAWVFDTPISFEVGDVLQMEFKGGDVNNQYARFVAFTNNVMYLAANGDKTAFDNSNTDFDLTKINGSSIVKNSTLIPTSGDNVITVGSYVAGTIGGIGAGVSSTGNASLRLNLPLYNFKIIRNGVVLNDIPLTNKDQGATQLAAVGDVNATMLGYSEDVWIPNNSYIPAPGYGNDVAIMDGFSQYWQLSSPIEIPANSDFEVKFKIKGSKQAFEGLLDSTDGSFWLRFLSGTQTNNLQGYIDSSFLSAFPFSSVNLRDDIEHEIIVKRIGGAIYLGYDDVLDDTGVVNNIAVNIHRVGRYSTVEFEGYIKDFSVTIDGVEEHNIPLTSKSQGAHQLPIIGTVGASMINYTVSVWP